MQSTCVTFTPFPVVTNALHGSTMPTACKWHWWNLATLFRFHQFPVSVVCINFRVTCHAHGSMSPPPQSRSWIAPSQACSCAFMATAFWPDCWQTLIHFTYLHLSFHLCYRKSFTLHVRYWNWLFLLGDIPMIPPSPKICVRVVVWYS